MAKPSAERRWLWILGCSLALMGAGSSVLLLLYTTPRPAAETEPGRNVLARGIADSKPDQQLLATLSWNDVAPTAEGVNADKGLRDEVIRAAGRSSHAPAVYMRGLLLLASNDVQSALETFLRIAPAEIPPSHLYAPYRLHNVLKPSQPNPFLAAMRSAVWDPQMQPLVQARVFADQGELPEALKAYLKSDPADWTSLDMRALRGMRLHAALANDTAAMLQAALKAGRIPNNLRGEVVELVKAPVDPATMEDLKKQFLHQINADPALRQAAITGAIQQLEVRRKFVAKKYRELLDEKRAASAIDLPDETVLMLTLAAGRLEDGPEFDRWSQELNRRYPTQEVTEWLRQLRARPQ